MTTSKVSILLLALCCSVQFLQTAPTEAQGTTEVPPTKAVCKICEELKKESTSIDIDSLKNRLEEDKKNVREAFRSIETELNEINEKVWWVPRNDVAQLQNETKAVRDLIMKKNLGVKDIESKTGAIRTKIEVYEAEKETNKAKALEQWGMVLLARHRLYNIEKLFLDAVVLAEDLAAVAHMDRLRVFANGIAKRLKDVIDYYDGNTAMLQDIHSNLHEIAVKKVEVQTKSISHKKSRCAFLFFFCD